MKLKKVETAVVAGSSFNMRILLQVVLTYYLPLKPAVQAG
jgi:hypothetical protein